MSQDDTAVIDEVVTAPTAPESAPEETKPEAEPAPVQKDDGELVPQETDSKTETVADDTAETPADETKAQPEGEEELAPKSVNRFQQLANQNRELKEQIERLTLQESQIATEQELLNEINPETGDYYTPAEVERIAFAKSREQQAQTVSQERYALEVQQNQQTLASEATQALAEFSMFDEKSPDYNPELTAQADQLLANALVIRDGIIVGSTQSPYQIYKTIADATKANEAKLQANAQKATEKMLANADVPSSSQQGKPSFNKLSAKEMESELRAKGYDI